MTQFLLLWYISSYGFILLSRVLSFPPAWLAPFGILVGMLMRNAVKICFFILGGGFGKCLTIFICRKVLVDTEFWVKVFFSVLWMCHPTAFWFLSFLMRNQLLILLRILYKGCHFSSYRCLSFSILIIRYLSVDLSLSYWTYLSFFGV